MFGIDDLAVATVGASLIGGIFGSSGQEEANEANEEIARENRAFQERMSRNAHQYEVEDLRKAGLNPLLTAGGAGASTPSGSVTRVENPKSDLAKAISSTPELLMSFERNRAQVDQTEAQKNLIEAQSSTVRKQNELLDMQIQWYKDHPGSAPNIPGQAASNSIKSWFDTAYDVGGRVGEKLGQWLYDNSGHSSNRLPKDEVFRNRVKYFMSLGESENAAISHARRSMR